MCKLNRKGSQKVPENFEPLFDNVFKGEDCGIYAAYGNTMHLLAKNSEVYRIFQSASNIPACITEMQNIPHSNKRLCNIIKEQQRDKVNLAFVVKNSSSDRIRVFAKSEGMYHKLPERECIPIQGIADTLLVYGKLLIKSKNCYKAVELIPVLECANSNTAIFCTGEREFFRVLFQKSVDFCSLGYFKKFIKTTRSTLLELKCVYGGSSLYHINKRLRFVSYSPIGVFSIDATTGNIRCFSTHGFVSLLDKSGVFILKEDQYQAL